MTTSEKPATSVPAAAVEAYARVVVGTALLTSFAEILRTRFARRVLHALTVRTARAPTLRDDDLG